MLGRIADIYGRVRLYNWGFAIFAIASRLSGLSMTDQELLTFRLLQGMRAALLFVNSVALVTDAFEGSELGKGIGIKQVAINAGTITGYTLSGILIQLFTWRSIFLIDVPIGIFGTYWSRKRLREWLVRPAMRNLNLWVPSSFPTRPRLRSAPRWYLPDPLDATLILIGPISGTLRKMGSARP